MKQILENKKVKRNKDVGNFLVRYLKSLFHAINGFLYALRYEHNMVIMLAAVIVVTGAGFHFNINAYEWLFCLLCFGSVMATEMINTAIEAVVDLETTHIHPLARIAKDTAACASLIYSIVALIGGLIIFLPKIIEII